MTPQVEEFAKQMEIELHANEHKGDWREWKNVPEMICELDYHKGKLLSAIKEDNKALVKEYLADCANILMFIGNAGNLYKKD